MIEDIWTVRGEEVGYDSIVLQGAPQPVSLPPAAIIITASVKYPYLISLSE